MDDGFGEIDWQHGLAHNLFIAVIVVFLLILLLKDAIGVYCQVLRHGAAKGFWHDGLSTCMEAILQSGMMMLNFYRHLSLLDTTPGEQFSFGIIDAR
jgi:hypothetical protein